MEQHVALYRKWRPLVFDDVVGQDPIVRALKAQVAGGRISHAYLFTGTRGTGKTSCAKILARAACCENPQDGNPCNACPSCLSILNEATLDFTEIDAASNNGVDNIREMREEVMFTPAALSRRVYIVDEVHMLSSGAFNALLKTLEEPPKHVLFILATTEIHKVPATILSRCQRYDFRRIIPETISARLDNIAREEGIALDPDASMLLARLGDGSMRDAISLLDRSIPVDRSVTLEQVIAALGVPSPQTILSLFERLRDGDAPGALDLFSQAYLDGRDIVSLFDELLSLVRDLYLVRVTGSGKHLMSYCAFNPESVTALAQSAEPGMLEYFSLCIGELLSRLTRTAMKRIDAEICLMKMALRSPAEAPSPPPAKAPARREAPPPPREEAPPWTADQAEPAPEVPAEPIMQAEPVPPAEPAVQAAPDPLPKAGDPDLHGRFCAQVSGVVAPPVRAYLEQAKLLKQGDTLVIAVPEESMVFVDKPRNHQLFTEAAQAMGFKDARIITTGEVKKLAPDPLGDLLKKAQSLDIDIATQ